MHLFTVGESILKGLRVQRSKTGPCLAQSEYSAVVLELGDDTLSFLKAHVPGDIPPLEQAVVVTDKVQGLTTIQLEGYRSVATCEREQALVRVETMAGVGGRVALLPPVRGDVRDGDAALKYHRFPPRWVQFLGSEEDAAAAHSGLNHAMDALVILDRGGRFRIERTGGLRDQYNHSAPSIFNVRWDGKNLHMTPEKGKVCTDHWRTVAVQAARKTRYVEQRWAEAQASAN
jgi:hypothetical protein